MTAVCLADEGLLSAPMVLHSRDRRDVLWVGGTLPAELTGELIRAGFGVIEITVDADDLDARAPSARALVVEVSPDESTLDGVSALIPAALNHGLLVVFTIPLFAEDDPHSEQEALDHCYRLTKPLVDPARVIARYSDWDRIVKSIQLHDPRSGCNRLLAINGDVPVDAAADVLLRRAFWDFNAVTMEALQPGKSGAAVWIVRPSASDRRHRAAPFLVKWNALAKMREEKSNVLRHACNAVSFRLTPPLHEARCVEGNDSGLLVFDFIDRALTFTQAIQHYPAGQLIGSLFDHTLAGCLCVAEDVTGSAVETYRRTGLFRKSAELDRVADVAQMTATLVPPAGKLYDDLNSLPSIPHRIATAHGDLHVENLLVATGSSDVLLIDFGKILSAMPVATDAACLEVSMCFAPEASANALGRRPPHQDSDWLFRAYSYPMDPHGVPPRDDSERWLAEAVRAVRGVARQHDPSAAAYAIAVVVYLLRYASYADNGPLDDRVVAYRIAAKLIDALLLGLAQR